MSFLLRYTDDFMLYKRLPVYHAPQLLQAANIISSMEAASLTHSHIRFLS